jgi:hypothetical protein
MTDEGLKRLPEAISERIEKRFSHVEFDRRIRAIEQTQNTLVQGFAKLQSRVDRLEKDAIRH